MCGPMIGLLATGISAIGSIYQAQASARASDSNARYLERQSQLERDKADFDAKRARERKLRLLGHLRSNYLASGFVLDGSAPDVLVVSDVEAALDIAAIRSGGEVESTNYR